MKRYLNIILIPFVLILIGIIACTKDENPEPEINWVFLAHYSSEVTNAIEYGETPRGIRVDLYFEGSIIGDLINGTMSGIDYYLSRENNPDEINAYATIITDDNARISVHITGYVYDDGKIQDEIVSFETGHKDYLWLNTARLTGNGMMTSENTFEVDYYYEQSN